MSLTTEQIQKIIAQAAQDVTRESRLTVTQDAQNYLVDLLSEKKEALEAGGLTPETLYSAALQAFNSARTDQLLDFYKSKGRRYLNTPEEDLQEAALLHFTIDASTLFRIKLPWPWGT